MNASTRHSRTCNAVALSFVTMFTALTQPSLVRASDFTGLAIVNVITVAVMAAVSAIAGCLILLVLRRFVQGRWIWWCYPLLVIGIFAVICFFYPEW